MMKTKALIMPVVTTGLVLTLYGWALYGQQPVNQTQGPPPWGTQSLYYSSGGLSTYTCIANSVQQTISTITVSAASNANPVSFTATAHAIGDFTNLGSTVTPIV